jgi:hypothetical protein
MSAAIFQKLSRLLKQIDWPGSFCVSGNFPVVLPGLEVEGLGPVGLPLTASQAKELKAHCEQAPYGKGEVTLVDTSVRRVWHVKPDRFKLTNPEWEPFLRQIVFDVQDGLGLEKQPLESHLYDLLLYEPGSFFLPHRDGEKVPRMVATLVVVLPSSFEGGELVVRHDGQEETVRFRSKHDPFRVHYAAFYADCEHEVRPLCAGHRLCLVYNLTLKKGKKGLPAPRSAGYVEPVGELLRDWAGGEAARRLAITLDHQYTQDGLTWGALKGADLAKARVVLEAAGRADCQAALALLTYHESGAAEDDGSYWGYGRSRWGYYEEEVGEHEMAEIFDTSLTADHWIDADGEPLPLGEIVIDESELLEPGAIRAVEPEEHFQGYTGNEGMTLDRWYRRAAIFVWPVRRRWDVYCDAGNQSAIAMLTPLVQRWRRAGKKAAAALRQDALDFAATIIERWAVAFHPHWRYGREEAPAADLLPLLLELDAPELVKSYLSNVLARDAGVDPGKSLAKACAKYGWATFRRELEAVFAGTTAQTLDRNVGLLEHLAAAKPKQPDDWLALSRALAETTFAALAAIDDQKRDPTDYWPRHEERAGVLAGLARSLLLTDQGELLSRLVAHALARSEKYPLTSAHVAALTDLGPWLGKHVKEPVPPLSDWLAACCGQLEALTAEMPQPPPDLRREATIACKCEDCAELRRFLADPQEREHRFRMREDRRQHLEHGIRQHGCDVDTRTERGGSPHTLVCTKNTASYEARLKKYHEDREHLAALRAIAARFPSRALRRRTW